ncbi:hypothetical protein ILUMI_08318 [Ignelater luminosus]|uniref:Uncharacterized protein n=1 Tax=Ignelater luminosus TaxID=2038154 RepID=A0A8K0GDI8_IGNLU|nr:hypothetical protein ILUMI_08318 [Ignelater luminosus]
MDVLSELDLKELNHPHLRGQRFVNDVELKWEVESFFEEQEENLFSLISKSEACDTSGVSDRSASVIVNAVLKDLGLVNKADLSNIIDKNKIRTERKKRRTDLIDFIISGIYFDGRKDKTLTVKKEESTRHTIREKNIMITAKPQSRYLGHVSPTSENANICGEISTKLLLWVATEQSLIAAQKMTENDNPNGFTGIIGKLFDKCEQMSLVTFQSIEVELPPVDLDELSTFTKCAWQLKVACIPTISKKTTWDDIAF